MYATHIYLEHMEIPIVRSHDFLGRTRLLHLHLNHSSISEIQPLAFNTLPSLQVSYSLARIHKLIEEVILYVYIKFQI